MIGGIGGVATSALNAAQYGLNATAHNLANLNTQGFAPQHTVNATSQAGQGVEVSAVRSAPALGENAPSATKVTDELTSQQADSRYYQANAKVLAVEDKVLGSLLDVKA